MAVVIVTFLLAPSYHVHPIKLLVLGGIEKSFKVNAMLLQQAIHVYGPFTVFRK